MTHSYDITVLHNYILQCYVMAFPHNYFYVQQCIISLKLKLTHQHRYVPQLDNNL